ncbi:MAG: ABC transporter [Deltaproteobacteria bacterium HGW-Deltaproteobacteria-2]|jgi:lipooligosaccharide transport system ATP-binding protein|nr:MAG: ABC transporter [Deltaproteobacteria bacterium HGW-Deltaproteobacteria-2]
MSSINEIQPVIAACNIKKSFGAFTAVDDISFSVDKGMCFGILGPNGAGKTSTIRMIYGFSPLTSGDIFVFGLDIKKLYRKIKARIGVCQQDNTLDPDLTVIQNFEVFARYFNIDRKTALERASSLLKFFALEQRRGARATELSGGMVRRLVIARALINQPDLLILDEPTTGLDPQSRHQVWERLENLKKQGMTILLTTHYMDEAERLCDNLVIMDHGKILAQGSPQSLISEYTGENIIEVAEPEDDLRTFSREKKVRQEDLGHRLIIYAENGHELYQEICGRFAHKSCILRSATLEDVFLKLTGRELRE